MCYIIWFCLFLAQIDFVIFLDSNLVGKSELIFLAYKELFRLNNQVQTLQTTIEKRNVTFRYIACVNSFKLLPCGITSIILL